MLHFTESKFVKHYLFHSHLTWSKQRNEEISNQSGKCNRRYFELLSCIFSSASITKMSQVFFREKNTSTFPQRYLSTQIKNWDNFQHLDIKRIIIILKSKYMFLKELRNRISRIIRLWSLFCSIRVYASLQDLPNFDRKWKLIFCRYEMKCKRAETN